MKLMIGENIRAYRKKHDLTQEELAERLGRDLPVCQPLGERRHVPGLRAAARHRAGTVHHRGRAAWNAGGGKGKARDRDLCRATPGMRQAGLRRGADCGAATGHTSELPPLQRHVAAVVGRKHPGVRRSADTAGGTAVGKRLSGAVSDVGECHRDHVSHRG